MHVGVVHAGRRRVMREAQPELHAQPHALPAQQVLARPYQLGIEAGHLQRRLQELPDRGRAGAATIGQAPPSPRSADRSIHAC